MEDWLRLNDEEKKLCKQNGFTCALVLAKANKAFNKADSAAAANNAPAHNNIYDAYRHAYWQALVRRSHGVITAIQWANAHERFTTSREETCMDQFNNNVGRTIGGNNPNASDDQLWALVVASTALKTAPYSC